MLFFFLTNQKIFFHFLTGADGDSVLRNPLDIKKLRSEQRGVPITQNNEATSIEDHKAYPQHVAQKQDITVRQKMLKAV